MVLQTRQGEYGKVAAQAVVPCIPPLVFFLEAVQREPHIRHDYVKAAAPMEELHRRIGGLGEVPKEELRHQSDDSEVALEEELHRLSADGEKAAGPSELSSRLPPVDATGVAPVEERRLGESCYPFAAAAAVAAEDDIAGKGPVAAQTANPVTWATQVR